MPVLSCPCPCHRLPPMGCTFRLNHNKPFLCPAALLRCFHLATRHMTVSYRPVSDRAHPHTVRKVYCRCDQSPRMTDSKEGQSWGCWTAWPGSRKRSPAQKGLPEEEGVHAVLTSAHGHGIGLSRKVLSQLPLPVPTGVQGNSSK